MTTPTETIKFSDIESEFGRNGSKSLGAYRISQSAGLYSNLPLDTGIPQSGSISFSQLRGKTLNIVVDISGGDEYKVNMRSKYNTGSGVTVIGGFASKPANPSGKKIYISVNKKIGSDTTSRNSVALRTGDWGTSSTLSITLGNDAEIYGAGGKGGDFTASLSQRSGTAIYADSCFYYRSYKGNFYLYKCKGREDPLPPEGDWSSNWYPGNPVVIGYGKGTIYGYEARRDWSTIDKSFFVNKGSSGSSAFGVDYPCEIYNYGYIQNGFGGGGAGGYKSF